MAVARKSIDQKIAELEGKLKALKAQKADNGLDAKSSGVDKLITAVDAVTKANNCKVIDVIKTIARIKKTPVTITQTPRTATKRKTKGAAKKSVSKQIPATTSEKTVAQDSSVKRKKPEVVDGKK